MTEMSTSRQREFLIRVLHMLRITRDEIHEKIGVCWDTQLVLNLSTLSNEQLDKRDGRYVRRERRLKTRRAENAKINLPRLIRAR